MKNRAFMLFPLVLFIVFLVLYGCTAAPSVLSGDSAEFQLAAATLGVPHPTTYPVYTLLGHLAIRVLPSGTIAWRVTFVSSLCAALAVGLFAVLARRITGRPWPALTGALVLGFAPGLWNAATLAEVYALLALLIVASGMALMRMAGRNDPADPPPVWPAALLAGLGFTHHGLFSITVLPLFAVAMIIALRQTNRRPFVVAILAFLVGMTPWLYPLIQFARLGPFDGIDYGLPRHYFWGAPQSWQDVIDLLTGGTVRRGIFHLPGIDSALATVQMVGQRLWFEFGPVGVVLGLAGATAMARRMPWVWRAAAWVFFATLAYLLLLGPAVGDAPVFTLPMLLPWALWIAAGTEAVTEPALRALVARRQAGDARTVARARSLLLILLVVLTVGWGATRYRVSAKQHLWLYREFAVAALARVPPGAVVITHWEQGMTLHYMRLVEDVRPDVWVDVVEPGDDPWLERAQRRYAGRAVYVIGQPASVAGMPVDLVYDEPYADVYRLRQDTAP